jgi:hypothetical protein
MDKSQMVPSLIENPIKKHYHLFIIIKSNEIFYVHY